MKNVLESIKNRRSVRTYDGRTIEDALKEDLIRYANTIVNPYHIPVSFRFLSAKEHGLLCPVVTGTDLYVGAKTEFSQDASVAFGYAFEQFVLYAKSLGLGTVWLGGTMNRPAYEKAMMLEKEEFMPCACAIGYVAEKPSKLEAMMRKSTKAGARLAFEELFFDTSFDKPLTEQSAGSHVLPLQMVRLAPSAVNKQPWRVITDGDSVHFYLKRSKGFARTERLDMQMVDMGIALCHYALSAKELGMKAEFFQEAPGVQCADMQYIASYKIK